MVDYRVVPYVNFFIVIFDLTLHVFDWEQLGDEIILLWKKKLIKQELELR